MVEKERGQVAKSIRPSLRVDMQRGIAASERLYQRWSGGMVHTRDGKCGITEEMDIPYLLKRMEAVARRITKKNEGAIQRITGRGFLTYGQAKHQITSLGTAILGVCFDTVPLMESAYPSCCREIWEPVNKTTYAKPIDPLRLDGFKVRFNPYLSIMLRACQRAKPALYWAGGKNLNVDDPNAIRAFEDLLRFVRRFCRSKQFKSIQNSYVKCAQDNLQSCCHYMAAKFANHSRLLILRVELYITPEHREWATTGAANRCIRQFLRAVRESRIVPDVCAWICKRENGFQRGIHCHLLVAMDGHKHRQAATYARLLGEAWQDRYSDGHGSYFNCWARRWEYPMNCLGLLHLSNRMMLLGLYAAIEYMTKSDYQVQTGYKKNLWKGITRVSWNAVKRGAPRKAMHDLALVKEILGDV